MNKPILNGFRGKKALRLEFRIYIHNTDYGLPLTAIQIWPSNTESHKK